MILEKIYIYYQQISRHEDSAKFTKKGLKKYLTVNDLEAVISDLHIDRHDKNSKPFFREYSEIFHNVSHSGGWWVCAYGPVECGLDLQKMEQRNVDVRKIASRFFHSDEISWLSHNNTEQFYRLWAYNESYVKFTGAGLIHGLEYFSVIPPAGAIEGKEIPGVSGCCQQELDFPEKNYWLVLTTEYPVEVFLEPLSTS